jgi:hypothetical protein
MLKLNTKEFIMSELTHNPKAYMNGSYVNFMRMGKRCTGFVSEVFDEGFAVDMVVHNDKGFPGHNTEYTVFVKTEDAFR